MEKEIIIALERKCCYLDVVIDFNSKSLFIVEDDVHADVLNFVGSYKPVCEKDAIKFLLSYKPELAYKHLLLNDAKIKYNILKK